ncbi:hypothetical protein TcBrA4_0040470 [Trypanosoma cruzi]|nr:hypothetical protein TcBrA4_0040470 [Trypanosoma cruzi]
MTSRMRAAGVRSMSLLRQLLSVTGRWESRLDAVLSGLGRSSTAPRRQFRGMAPALGDYRTARGRHALATRPRWRSASPCIPSGQAPVPRATAVGCGRALPYLLGEVHRIRQDRWRRVGLWGARVAFAAYSLMRWLTLRCLLSIGPSDFPAGVLKERGA